MNQAPLSDPGEKRRNANRRNSQASTGPKDTQASSQNALKYGFFSSKALLPGERWEDFVNFRQSLLEQLCPSNRFEDHVMDQYIPLAWRMRRLPEIEAFAFTRYGISAQGNQCGPGFGLVASVQTDNILGQLSRYEATLRKNAFKYLQLLLVLRKE